MFGNLIFIINVILIILLLRLEDYISATNRILAIAAQYNIIYIVIQMKILLELISGHFLLF